MIGMTKYVKFSGKEIAGWAIAAIAGYSWETVSEKAKAYVFDTENKIQISRSLRKEGIAALRLGDTQRATEKFTEANALLMTASNVGSAEASYLLGLAYCTGRLGVTRDLVRGRELIRSSSKAAQDFVIQERFCDEK